MPSEVDGSVTLPDPPFALSMTLRDKDDNTIDYEFVDPDPGHVSKTSDQGDLLLSVTIRTFAVPLEPGDYTITKIEVDAEALSDVPVVMPPVPTPDEDGVISPTFTVVDDAPCTFIGELTSIAYRFPPLGPLEAIEYAQTFAEGATGMLTTNPGGALFSGALGLGLLDGIVEADLAGHSWWVEGEQIDETLCVTQEVEF